MSGILFMLLVVLLISVSATYAETNLRDVHVNTDGTNK